MMSFRNFILGLGIFIVYALVLWQGIQAFYPAPLYEDYCDFYDYPVRVANNCTAVPGIEEKQSACIEMKGEFRYRYDSNGCAYEGYCEECGLNYNEASDSYSRNVFIISLIVGIITFVVGFFVLSVEPIGSALLASGVWAIFYGTVWNWRNFGVSLRFFILLVVLLLLIWIAFRFNKNKSFLKKR